MPFPWRSARARARLQGGPRLPAPRGSGSSRGRGVARPGGGRGRSRIGFGPAFGRAGTSLDRYAQTLEDEGDRLVDRHPHKAVILVESVKRLGEGGGDIAAAQGSPLRF